MLNMIYVRILGYKQMLPVYVSMTVMAVVLIYIFGVGFSQEFKPGVAVVNEDGSEESHRIVSELMAEKTFEVEEVGMEEALERVTGGKAIAAIVIPNGYADTFYTDTKDLRFIKTSESMEIIALEMALESVVQRTFGNKAFVDGLKPAYGMLGLELDETAFIDTVNEFYSDRPMAIVETEVFSSESAVAYDALKQSFMGFILFFSLFTMVFGIGSIVEDKDQRVWHRQVVSPIKGSEVLGSAIIVGFGAGIIQIGTMVFFGTYIFDINLGKSFPALMLVFSAYIIAALCMGLFISSFVKSEQQLSAVTPMIIVSTSMLGGCMWPLELVSNDFIRNLSIVTPQRWAMEGLQQVIVYQGNVSDVVSSVSYLLILAIVFFALAVIPYRKTA